AGKIVNLDFSSAPIDDTLEMLTKACDLNIVVSGSLHGKPSTTLQKVPCDQALEAILESAGLWYDYDPTAKLVRIDDKHVIDDERHRRPRPDDALPPGPALNFSYKHARVQDVIGTLVKAGDVNVVLPDHIHCDVSMFGNDMPWDAALRGVLRSCGLG